MQFVQYFTLILISSLLCFDLSAQCIGGNYMTTTEGDTLASFCVNQGEQKVRIDPGRIGTPFAYILTDEDGIIQKIQLKGQFDFSNSDPGTCFIYGISFAGILYHEAVGEHIYSVRLASICYEFAANRIRIEKGMATGGELAFSDGTTEQTVCAQDGQTDILSFQTSSPDTSYVYLITDEDGDIIDVVDDQYDFNQSGPEESLVIGLSYSGMLLAAPGMNAFEDELADGCFALSDNTLSVLRTFVEGGSVTTTDGKQKVFTCLGDGIPDSLFFVNNGSSPADYVYVITDENGVVKGFTTDGADFEASIPAVSLVYGLSYAGTLTLSVGDTIEVQTPVQGCFDWSDNSVEVIQDVPDGGTVSTLNGAQTIYTCPGDGTDDLYFFTANNASNSEYAFVFTDEHGIVESVLGGNNIDFEDFPEGVGMIYGIAYTGDFLVEEGDSINAVPLSSECHDLSDNAVEVIRERPEGGILSFQSGGDSLSICKGDGISDVRSIVVQNNAQAPYLFILTDSSGQIVDTMTSDSIDFETTPDGTARVYGVSYTGSFEVNIGTSIDTAQFSDDCYDLSDNYLQIDPLDVFAGRVHSEFGDSLAFICAEDTSLDRLSLSNTSGTPFNYAYVITEASVIETIVLSDTLYLDSIEQGTYRMRGIAYIGDLTIEPGDTLPQSPSNSCYAWSINQTTLQYGNPDVGTISLQGGGLHREVCSNDSSQLVFLERNGGSPTEFTWILTDSSDIVLGLINEDSLSMATAPPGEYSIHGVTGSPLPDFNIGLELDADSLEQNLCLDLSDTSITIIKTEVSGGSISFTGSSNGVEYFCPGDTVRDYIGLERMNAVGAQYAYLCIDRDNVVRTGTMSDTLEASSLPAGEYSIVGVSYYGDLLVQVGDTLGMGPLSTACAALSDNRLNLIGEMPDGGMVQTTDGEQVVEVVVGDGIPDLFTFEAIGASNTPYTYVVTDSTDKILAILPDSTVNFEMVPPGENRVYGIAYTGNLLIDGGEFLFTTMLSDDCYDVSDNAVIFHLVPDTSGIVGGKTGDMASISATVLSGDQSIELRLENELDKQTDGILRVFDLSGRLLHRSSVRLSGGANSLHIPVQVDRGMHVYFIQLLLEDGRSWSRKVIPLGER